MSTLPPHEGYIPVGDGRVWYQIIGTGPGIPLLALHGGPGLGSDGLQPLAALAEDRPVVLYDQLGGGRSDRPDNPALWNITRFVEELATVRAALGLAQVHIFGHSYGTILAAEHALSQPSGLQSLILSGPVMSVPRYFSDLNRQKQELPIDMQEAIERNEAAGTFDAPEYQNASLEWMRRHFCRNEAILATILEEIGDPVTGVNLQVYNTMWGGPSEFWITGNLKDWECISRLSEIKVPTLFMCGRYDGCTPDAIAWYCSLTPHSRSAVFEQSAHMTHLEEPEPVLATIRDFLRSVDGMQK